MGSFPTCSLCGGEIFPKDHRTMNKQVVGFQRPRGPGAKGGLHALRLARDTGAVAHDSCVDTAVSKAKAGTSIRQGGLF